MDLKSAILSYRAVHCISQVEFAKLVGVSTQTIHSLENGYQRPSKVTMAKILLVLNDKREVDLEKWAKKEQRKADNVELVVEDFEEGEE